MSEATKKEFLEIEIVSDPVCPWCFIGKRRLEKALTLVSLSTIPKITWKPFELNPTLATSGADYRQYLIHKFGDSEEVRKIQNHLQEAAESSGIHFEFDRIERLPNTFDAHRLIWFAGTKGLQNHLVDRLFRAVFLEGLYIGDRRQLVEIADAVKLDPEEVRLFLVSDQGREEVQNDKKSALRRGVQGVPNFLINGRFIVRGAQSPEVMAQFLKKAVNEQESNASH
jgi:predicted DsbA family dithiol-disulfide isomerase